jgi:hypothetical protein
MKYAVMIDVDGDLIYVPNSFPVKTIHDDPKLFDTIEDAEQECNNWNTGTVVEYVTSKDIRPMDESERNRARVRSIKNQSNLEFDKAIKKMYEGDDWDNWCDGDTT